MFTLLTSLALAQGIGQDQIDGLWQPNQSQGARVGQTIALTNVEIVYHRPSVGGRELFGGLVPWDRVWRTGANENTTISVSTDVTVQGEPLPAGTYGLHTIPGEQSWTVIFSSDHRAWGSYAYDEAHDALRVTTEATSAPHTEQLQFTFDDVTDHSAVVHLRWGEVDVPLTVGVDRDATVLASFREQLQGLGQFGWTAPFQAARWCLTNEVALEEGLEWAEQSILAEPRFENLFVKAGILKALGREDDSDAITREALKVASAGDLHQYGRTLQAQGDPGGAMKVFRRNARENPGEWFVEVGLARGYAGLGKLSQAAAHMRKAAQRAPENQVDYIEGLVARLERGDAI